ncbi:MAG TPA: glycoside hydrolase family 64 protein, partial [Chryseosolibacter sp.]|nr:glycoside hydrolase family 64 protein [Chryseosolibacter sp.]
MKKRIRLLSVAFFSGSRAVAAAIVLTLFSTAAWSQATVPFTLSNNSSYTDANIFVAVVGMQGGTHVWIDTRTGTVRAMSSSDNTVQGPIINGDGGPGGNGKYANCFARLSEIPNKTINIPGIAGCRILISFNSQLWLYFFGPTQGYAAPNLANPNDPNQGIRFEMIELTNAPNGLWANTTRVDSYQYPMGLEVWGNSGFYKKVGELKTHSQILSQWQSTAPAAFAGCYDAAKGIIHFPSKTAAFQSGGSQANYFGSYIDAIWSKYTGGDLVFNAGDAGTWRGRVSGSTFTFTRTSDGQVARITRKPTTIETMEGSGVLAEGGQWDKVVQAQICAAINRHAIDLNLATGATQDFATDSKYYITSPFNWYCKFWHQTDISHNGLTYAFCYDDVFDKSSTINAPSPTRATITIGGFAGLPQGVTTVYKDCSYSGSAVGLPVGDYTLSAMNARGILNDDISSLRVS